MIGYTTLGTNDLAKGGAFYDDVLGLLGDNFYGAYFRDLDGNKLVAFVMG